MSPELPAPIAEHVARREAVLARIRGVLVGALKVPLPPEQIELDAPLFGTGLGLDSVDAVELVVAIETEFGLHLPEGSAGPSQFRTVHSLVELVMSPPVPPATTDPTSSAPTAPHPVEPT